MDILDMLLVAYLAIAGIALCMTGFEQKAQSAPALFVPLGCLACILWPLPVMAMLAQQNLQRARISRRTLAGRA